MKLIRILLLMVFLAVLVPVPATVRAQTSDVTAILNSMTPEERGVFLVTFTGADTSETSRFIT
jgi:hypothetical protein